MKKFAKIILIPAVFLLCTVLLLEGAYRVYRYLKHGHVGFVYMDTVGILGNHDVYGYCPMPNFDSARLPDRMRFSEEGRGYRLDKDIKINSRGFRGKEFSAAKKEGAYRVFASGGSTTYCLGDNDKTWPAYLEEMLGVEVINGGVPNWESIHSLTRFKNEGIYLKPDLIILHSGLNDLWKGTNKLVYGYGLRACPDQIRNIETEVLPAEAPCFIAKHLLLYQQFKVRVLNRYIKYGDDKRERALNARILTWKKNICKIIDIAQKNGIRVILVDYPVLARKDASPEERKLVYENTRMDTERHYDYWIKAKGLISEGLHDIAKQKGLTVVEAEEAFDGYGKEERMSLFVDEIHLSEKGDFLLAECVEQKISENKDKYGLGL